MIDPDGIVIQEFDLPNVIKMNDIPACDLETYCLDDEKEYAKFIKDVESNIRRSFEYRQFINYLRENMQMNQDAFLENVSNEENFKIRIEIHHYPFTLHDIVDTVIKKRLYYKESMSVQMVSKEVMELHYKFMVGLIPLSETVHELAHNSRIFIPVDKIAGRYKLFVDYYRPFIDDSMIETLERIEKYTYENRSKVLDTSIIDQKKVYYDIKNKDYMLPDTSTVNNKMLEQIQSIKDNNYILPSIDDIKMLEDSSSIKNTRCPITIDYSLIKNPR